MIRIQVHVTGKVQGVCFRASTQQQSSQLSLTGWVQNQPDGSVLLEAQGEEDAIQQLLHWAEDGGPPAAKVQTVNWKSIPTKTSEQHFLIQ